jgi:hypothetical protein
MTNPQALLEKLTQNLLILEKIQKKYGDLDAPMELLNQIEEYRKAIELSHQVIAGSISQAQWQDELQPIFYLLEEQDNKAKQKIDFKSFLTRLKKNVDILEERVKKYGAAPAHYQAQIDDHHTAIHLTEQVLKGQMSEADWREALKSLLVDL